MTRLRHILKRLLKTFDAYIAQKALNKLRLSLHHSK